MRLKTKLVLATTAVTFGIVLLLSLLFLGELLRQRIAQTAAANNVLANQVRLATRQTLEAAHPAPTTQDAILHTLGGDPALDTLMQSIVRYSPIVQDVSVVYRKDGASGVTLLSTDPDALNQPAPLRASLASIPSSSLTDELRQLFGPPTVLDIAAPLDRNGQPFLVIHLGVRSTFLRASYAPWLNTTVLFTLLAAAVSVLAAGLLSNVALRPIENLNTQLELLTAGVPEEPSSADSGAGPDLLPAPPATRRDTVVQVAQTLDRLERKLRSNQAGYTALQTNLNQMLDALRDGVVLFSGASEPRAIMVSDAVQNFLPALHESHFRNLVGQRLEAIFPPETSLGAALAEAFATGASLAGELVPLEDGRQIEISLDRIHNNAEGTTLLTLRDRYSAQQFEQELELSRRLAAIGRLTAGVGHEVKNPINAMVLHLELLRGKLSHSSGGVDAGAERHLDILSSEMQRLDRVVQTLADFSRPLDVHLRPLDLRDLATAIADLTSEQMRQHGVRLVLDLPAQPLLVHADSDLIRQAVLNIVLNGMQAMTSMISSTSASPPGNLRLTLRREHNDGQLQAALEVADQGAGIPADLLPRIFELYFTTKPTGNGIGLATTYRILQLHGGALDVRSDADPGSPARGSVFTLRLPIAVSTKFTPSAVSTNMIE